MLSEGDIERIVRCIVNGYAPLAVGIFGSYAIGTAHAESDLDVVVIKNTAEDPTTRRRTVQRLLFDILHRVDSPVFTPAEFEESAQAEMAFGWTIARQARLRHWTEAAPRIVPSLFLYNRAQRENACGSLSPEDTSIL